MMTYNFYDTCSLLLRASNLFNDPTERIIISSITLKELEQIKTSLTKDNDIKYAARQLLRTLNNNSERFECYIYKETMLAPIIAADLEINNDTKILACAIDYDKKIHPDETIFITNDLSLKNIANLFFGDDSIASVDFDKEDGYTGFKIKVLSDDELAYFYSNPEINQFNLLTNEYLLIKNLEDEIIDSVKWDGTKYCRLHYGNFKSTQLGDIKPYKGDPFQTMICDSFLTNKITMVKGPAGSGKTFLSLGFLFYLYQTHKIDKIIIFCNTVATKGSAKLGFYPGTRDEKLLDSQIGNLLSSKIGDKFGVEELIERGALVLLPLSDLRGYDTSGMKAGIYISEAQNMDISLMKLALQRVGEDSICIIDGDDNAQVDLIDFAGANNGMKRASKVFRGTDIYGEVTLQNIYRSRIAELAEKM